LQGAAAPIVALLEVLLAKDPGERFQDPVRLQNALTKVKEAFAIQSEVARSVADKLAASLSPEERRESKRNQPKIWKPMIFICGRINCSQKFVFLTVGQRPGSRYILKVRKAWIAIQATGDSAA
jgi:hypothetical protein